MSSPRHSVSVVIPTYNEAGSIGRTLAHVRALGPAEIVVADGGSTDGTAEIASRLAVVAHAPRNRGEQLNAGAAHAKGTVLLFLHADVRLDPQALDSLSRALEDPAVVGGNFNIQYEGGDFAARVFSAVNRVRRRCGVFYGDSGIFCRRDIFEELGGFRPFPVLEDYEFARRLRRRGSLALLERPIHVSDRRWRRSSLLKTLWNWFWIQGLYLIGVSPHRLARAYRDVR